MSFPEPEPLLTKFARLPGTDGNAKMSKSLNNAILLSDDPGNCAGEIAESGNGSAESKKK